MGEACPIGSNATVLQKLRIGTRAIVGAGAVALRNVPDDVVVVVGNPTTVINSPDRLQSPTIIPNKS